MYFRVQTWLKRDMKLLYWRTKHTGRQWYLCLPQIRYQRETSNHLTSRSFDDEHCHRLNMRDGHLQATWSQSYGTPSLRSPLSNFILLSLLWWIVLRSSLPPETIAFLDSIATTVENVSYHLFSTPPFHLQTSSWVKRDTETNWRSSGAQRWGQGGTEWACWKGNASYADTCRRAHNHRYLLPFLHLLHSFFPLSLFPLTYSLTLFFPSDFILFRRVSPPRVKTCNINKCNLMLLNKEIIFLL